MTAVAFVRASRLYDVDNSESVSWDWSKMQPLGESQAAVKRAVEGEP